MARSILFLAIPVLLLFWAMSVSASSGANCSDRRIVASAVSTTSDVQAFVRCAAEYVMQHGTEEARRAFHEDERWRYGPTYVFVDGIAKYGEDSITHVYPPDPSREGSVWGTSIDGFGNDYFYELYRVMSIVDSGWIYSSFPNPATGRDLPKSSYVIEIDWNGDRAAIGAGVYALDLPGTCNAEEVNAADLESDPADGTLQAFVRCAAMMVESQGYFAKGEVEGSSRWSHGSSYVFVLDMMGNQVLTGNKIRVNGNALHEWGGKSMPTDQFGGRDIVGVGDTFGEAFIYYRALNPMTGANQWKVGILKRVVAQGVPLLVGAGYYVSPDLAVAETSCSDDYVTASVIYTRGDIQAFVQCAAEYVMEHGTGEARRAFHEDERWRHGPYYVFVRLLAKSGGDPLSRLLVYPPDSSREGISGTQVHDLPTDLFADYLHDLHRILAIFDSGWIHYYFRNVTSGTVEPKSSYTMAIDWDGQRVAIGAGIYQRDLPGTCDSREVNAAALEADPSDEKLQEFVRCAAMKVGSMGLFAGPVLSQDPRWSSGTIYVFGINADTGEIEFSGSGTSAAVSGRIPELLFDGRDLLGVGATFGEAFWYYNRRNRVTGEVEPKVAFVKLVLAQGVPLLVGSGYQLGPVAGSN